MTAARIAAAALVVVLLGGACSLVPPTERRLTVYGAASLGDVLHALAGRYELAHPNLEMALAADSSAALRTQIELGATPEVFLSADTANPAALAEAGLTRGPPVPFAANELTVIVPEGNPAGITRPADLAAAGVRVIAAGDAVPITRYADEAIQVLGALSGDATAFKEAYEANVVSREDNVRTVLAKIALGEGDAALVYATDAAASADVETVPLPEEARVVATYAGVVIGASARPDEAQAFLDWIVGPDGQAILADHGFRPPP